MELTNQQEITNTYSIKKAIVLTTLSLCIIGLNIYLSSQFISEVTRFNLSAVEKQVYAIHSGIALPLACLIISQLFIKWRGLKNAVNSVLFGVVIALVAQAPFIFYLAQ